MEERALDWKAAEVSDGTLTVPLTGDGGKSWNEEFGWVAERLRGGSAGWQDVKVAKKKVTVTGVTPGSESDVRHFLESVVQQVNADHAKPEQDGDGGDGEGDPAAEADRQMTDAFRAFAGQDESGEAGAREPERG